MSRPLGRVSTSSLIGVTIACSGNVLISLALYVLLQIHTLLLISHTFRTVQKLAHRRQNEELNASQSASSSSTSRSEPPQSPSHDATSPQITAVPVVVVPESPPTRRSGDTLVKLVEATAAESHGRDGERRKRSRSSSPLPIRILNGLRTDSPIKATSSQSPGSEQEDGQKDEVEEGAYLRSRLWWMGMVLISIGEGGNFLSYGFAPASVVAPLGTVVSGFSLRQHIKREAYAESAHKF